MRYMLAGCTNFNVCRYAVLEFLKLIVSIDEVDLETPISENGEDFFYTIDDVLGSSCVRCTECSRLAFADTIKSLGCVEFNLG